MVEGLREVLTSVFEFSNLLEQQRTGAITRQLAAWAAILAVPTAIAGIYGMNFENMPELKTDHGYFIVLGVIAVVCGALYVKFIAGRHAISLTVPMLAIQRSVHACTYKRSRM